MMRCHPRWSDKSEMIEVTATIRGGREKKRGLSRDFEYSRFDQVFDPRILDGFDRSKLDVRIEGRRTTRGPIMCIIRRLMGPCAGVPASKGNKHNQ